MGKIPTHREWTVYMAPAVVLACLATFDRRAANRAPVGGGFTRAGLDGECRIDLDELYRRYV